MEEVSHALPRALALHLRLQPAEPDHRAAPDEGQVRGSPQESRQCQQQSNRATSDTNLWEEIRVLINIFNTNLESYFALIVWLEGHIYSLSTHKYIRGCIHNVGVM